MLHGEQTLIEFCGIPGGRKSTTARAFVNMYPTESHLVHLPFRPLWRELWHAAQFAFRAPRAFIKSGWFIVRNTEAGLWFYSIHLWIRACAKHALAWRRPERFVLIDEGLLHVVATLSRKKLARNTARHYIAAVHQVDCVAIAREGTFHRFQKGRRVPHPRVKRGKQYLDEWKARVQHNSDVLHAVLHQEQACVWEISQDTKWDAAARALKHYVLYQKNRTEMSHTT